MNYNMAMDLLEIKHEFEHDNQLQCRSCLSIGRKLTPLGQYTNIYMKLIADVVYPNLLIQPIAVCWECRSLLRKVLLFQQQLKRAYELLLTNQNFTSGSLSNLVSITLNDTHQIVYLNENIVPNPNSVINKNVISNNDFIETEKAEPSTSMSNETVFDENDIKSKRFIATPKNIKDNDHIELNRYAIKENNKNTCIDIYEMDLNVRKEKSSNVPPLDGILTAIQSDNNNLGCAINCEVRNKVQKNKANVDENTSEEDDFDNYFNFETPKLNDIPNLKKELKSKHPKSRWAIKRALQNKKPKFKIALTDFGDAFTKVQINNEELIKCMLKERDGEYFKSKRFKCETCNSGFEEEKDWTIHNDTLHNEKFLGYTCDICAAKIADKRHLSAHIKQHYIVEKCTICQLICRNEETKMWHIQNVHRNMFQCLKCDLKFCKRREFYKHYKDWHEKYICDVCGVSFKMRYCIKEHIRKQHSPFSCVPCNKTFARYNGLWLHNKLAHAPAAPPAYCVECDITYKDIYRYKWHLCNSTKHTPKKKICIPCPDCKKTFTKKIYMKDHYNLVHLKLFRHRCEQCDKNFIRNAELVKHRRRKHEGILPPKNKICYLCGRAFTTNKVLRNHIRTHEKHDSIITSEDKLKHNQT